MKEVNWKDNIKHYNHEDLEGKILKMHYGYDSGYYCLLGEDIETNDIYILANEQKFK